MKKLCAVCRIEFKAQRETILCCSLVCGGRRRQRLQIIACRHCSKTFLPERATRLFCSVACKNNNRIGIPRSKITPGYWYENGYRIIQMEGKPIKQHRFVMETILGRKLSPNEIVHHRNHNREDNRPENLELMTLGEHSRLHRRKEVQSGKKLFKTLEV